MLQLILAEINEAVKELNDEGIECTFNQEIILTN